MSLVRHHLSVLKSLMGRKLHVLSERSATPKKSSVFCFQCLGFSTSSSKKDNSKKKKVAPVAEEEDGEDDESYAKDELLDETITRKGKQTFSIVQSTKVPTIFTVDLLDSDIEYTKYDSYAKRLFSMSKMYVSPKDFGYQLPGQKVPEFAFVGRSNVGKSSLVSTLLSSNKLVRISKEPGCTRIVNYYGFMKKKELGKDSGFAAYLIDLPGYGFARASKKDTEQWKTNMKNFLKTREFTILKRVYVLIDSRHGLKASDRIMLKLLNDCQLPYQVLLTKSDLSTSEEQDKALQSVFDTVMKKGHVCNLPITHVISAKTGDGIKVFKQAIAEIVYEAEILREELMAVTPTADNLAEAQRRFETMDLSKSPHQDGAIK